MTSDGKSRSRRQIPKYMEIAADIRQKIKTREWLPDHPVPSAAALCDQYAVSMSVTKRALDLLKSEGNVYGVFGVGTFVADRPNLVRISPERQLQNPEVTFGNESDQDIEVERTAERTRATADLAETFSIPSSEEITRTITRTSEGGRPISISDTYQPLDIADISSATTLEETVAEQLPTPTHAEWLGTPSGDRVKTVHQRFLAADDRVIMISNVSYPLDRYDAFVFRMTIPSDL